VKSISFEEFQKFLKAHEFELRASHNKLCFPIVKRLCQKMSLGVEFEAIKVERESIVNGHHRYVASILVNSKLERVPWTAPKSMTHCTWNKIALDANDWESDLEIKAHNERDALRAGLNVEVFNSLLEVKKDS